MRDDRVPQGLSFSEKPAEQEAPDQRGKALRQQRRIIYASETVESDQIGRLMQQHKEHGGKEAGFPLRDRRRQCVISPAAKNGFLHKADQTSLFSSFPILLLHQTRYSRLAASMNFLTRSDRSLFRQMTPNSSSAGRSKGWRTISSDFGQTKSGMMASPRPPMIIGIE